MSLAGGASYELTGECAPPRCPSTADGWRCEGYAGHAYSHSAGQGWAEWTDDET